jgi:hypothetical protein
MGHVHFSPKALEGFIFFMNFYAEAFGHSDSESRNITTSAVPLSAGPMEFI